MTQKPQKNKHHYNLYLISDSSGNLIEHFFNAILTQFPHNNFRIFSLSFVDSEDRILTAFDTIKSGIICYAVVDEILQEILSKEAKNRGFPCWDMTTPTVQFLEKTTGIRASNKVQAIHSIDASYMGRMAAIEFTLQHDDNRRIDQLKYADIILVGVSRVSKSPNALFLAYRGFKVANVSIVPSEAIPKSLNNHRRRNIVALTIQPKRLAEIRERRFSRWDINDFDYTDIPSIIHEVRDAEEIYRRRKWPVIDTTDLAVEETSSLILDTLKLKEKSFQQIQNLN